MKRFVRVALLCAVPVTVFAQSGLRDRDPDLAGAKKVAADKQQSNFHFGRFYLMSRFRLSDAGYSEQFFLPTGDRSGGGINVTIDAPHRLYYEPHKKTIFTAEFTPGYAFVSSGDKSGQFNWHARADAHFLLNHLYLDVYTLRASQLRSHAADVNRLTTVDEGETGIAGEFKYSSRSSALFAARYRDASHPRNRINPDPLDRNVYQLDRRETNGRLSFHHKTFPLTSLMVAGEVSQYEFEFADFKDSTRRWAGAGFVRDSGRMSIRAEAGPAVLDFKDASQRDFEGVVGSVSLSRSRSRWLFGATADRDLGFSILSTDNYYIAHRGRLNASYVANRKLTLRAATFIERDDYEGSDRRDTISFSTLGFLYDVWRLQAGADVGWYKRTSTIAAEEDSGIRVMLLLSFTPRSE